ncbi:MAG: hypothetical protein K6E20_05595 [Acholeplasmatales bacterium]|nr:hypothetical protein [Acholeplasmatales bacterium]
MEIIHEKNQIIVFGKPIKYDAMIKRMSNLSGEQMYNFLINRSIQIPRKMNCMAMVSVLNEKIKFLHSNSLSRDYFKRLQYYKSFSETQLSQLFEDIANDPDSYQQYRYNFCKLVLDNYAGLNITDGEINYLKTITKSKQNTLREYIAFISASALEQEDTFDGQDFGPLQSDLMYTATVAEVQKLGAKYGIDLPNNLTKDQYIDYILYYLGAEGRIEEDTEEKLNEMTLASLSEFSRKNGIPLQPQLDKSDIVNYLFYYLSQCEITLTSLNEIVADKMYLPLEFTVDVQSISPFGNQKAKKIISYDGDDIDSLHMDEILANANGIEPEEEIHEMVPEAPIMPGDAEKLVIENDEIMKEDDEGNLEVVEVVETNKENQVSNDSDNLSDEEIKKIIEKDNKPKEKEITYVSKVDVSKNTPNDKYGSKKFIKLNKGGKRFVLPVLGIILLIGIVAFLGYGLIR